MVFKRNSLVGVGAVRHRFRKVLRDNELCLFTIITVVATVLITVSLRQNFYQQEGWLYSLRLAFLEVYDRLERLPQQPEPDQQPQQAAQPPQPEPESQAAAGALEELEGQPDE